MKILLVLLGVLPFVACSTATEKCTAVNQTRIHQSLSASYSAESDRTSVSAQMRFGDGTGTTLEMVENCKIEHEHYSLEKESFLGTSYNADESGFRAAHKFLFTDNDKNQFENTATIREIDFSTTPSKIQKGSNNTISFTPAVSPDETVTVYLQDSKSKSASGSTTTNGSSEVTLESTRLTDMTAGTAEIYLTRTKSEDLAQAEDAGGNFRTSYETGHSSVTIE